MVPGGTRGGAVGSAEEAADGGIVCAPGLARWPLCAYAPDAVIAATSAVHTNARRAADRVRIVNTILESSMETGSDPRIAQVPCRHAQAWRAALRQ
ncbi:hypothetical protein WI40_15570 [Burkholderia ubonensis]|nr:hypothetical protein WI40_15570 [Burkholderia ubonensis]